MEKILFVHPYNNYTGSTKVLADILSAKYSVLSSVTVITATSQEGFLSDLGVQMVNVPILRINHRAIPLLSAFVWFLVGFIKTLIIAGKYDVVYINTLLPGFAAIAAKIRGKKVIYHIHEAYVKTNSKSLFGGFIFNRIISHRIFVSKYVETQYKPKHGCTSEVIYNKLNNSFLNNVRLVPLDKHRRNHILMLSTLQLGKGIDVFVNVARLLPEYTFSLVISSSRENIGKLFPVQPPTNLTIYPKQSNVHPFYEKADMVLNLSNPFFLVETFGLTILEGMAYGLPAIVPNAGGPMEVIENGITGYSIDVTNKIEVAKYIKFCLDEKRYSKLYANCLNRVKKFTLIKEY